MSTITSGFGFAEINFAECKIMNDLRMYYHK